MGRWCPHCWMALFTGMLLITQLSCSRPSTLGVGLWVSAHCPLGASPLPTLQKMVETQRQNVRAEFERLRRLLAEEEQRLLQRLEEEELEVLPPLQENAARLGQQSAQLADLVAELEGRCQLPALGLLQVSTCWNGHAGALMGGDADLGAGRREPSVEHALRAWPLLAVLSTCERLG